MDSSKDYYAILGVLPSIDQAALGAVYRALIKKYHPDVFSGDNDEGERKSKELNEAYSVIGDIGKRAEYDRAKKSQNANAGDYASQSANEAGGNGVKDDAIDRDWAIVVRYHPSVEQERVKLASISQALAFAFQISILDAKNAEHSEAVSAGMKSEFLQRYFGSNQNIHAFILEAIAEQRRDVALAVNRAIKVIGTPSAKLEREFMRKIAEDCNWEPPTARRERRERERAVAEAKMRAWGQAGTQASDRAERELSQKATGWLLGICVIMFFALVVFGLMH